MRMILAFQPTMPSMIQENYKRSAETMTTNSGIDLYYPGETKSCNEQIFVDFQLKAVLLHDTPKPFYLYPRSSISKTPFRLANSVGIIDQDYRGNLGAYLDVIHPDATLYHGVRLCQLCAPSLEPCSLEILPMEVFMEWYGNTSRGEQGFGSTGV